MIFGQSRDYHRHFTVCPFIVECMLCLFVFAFPFNASRNGSLSACMGPVVDPASLPSSDGISPQFQMMDGNDDSWFLKLVVLPLCLPRSNLRHENLWLGITVTEEVWQHVA